MMGSWIECDPKVLTGLSVFLLLMGGMVGGVPEGVISTFLLEFRGEHAARAGGPVKPLAHEAESQ